MSLRAKMSFPRGPQKCSRSQVADRSTDAVYGGELVS